MIRKTTTRAIAATLACALTIVLGSAVAGAAPATIILGAAKPANASCPDDCLVEARVTGFQTSIGKQLPNPFVAPEDGEIVAWSIKLGKPRKPDRRAFNDEFGPASARLGVLRRVGTNNPPRYKLLRQSPVEELGPFFGSTTTFTLTTPLPVREDEVVALTIPSWAPALAVGQGAASEWMASRRPTNKRGDCTDDEGRANLDAGAPQVKKGSQRPYGCAYDRARLLYSATFLAG